MRIAFLGNFQVPYSSENHHKATLEEMGHEIIHIQENSRINTDQIYNIAANSDLFIWIHTHGWSNPGTPTIKDMTEVLRLLKGKTTTISYHLDLWHGLERQKDLTNDGFYLAIEHFFVTDKLMSDWFNKKTDVKGHYLPAAVFGPEVYQHDNPSGGNDVIFVGSKGYHPEWPYRPKLINWLREEYGSRFTHVGGDGDTGTVRGDRLNALYADSKVSIGDTLCIGYDYPYYFSDRLFESIGRGGFTIFPYIKGLEDNFELGKELITYEYDNFDQLKELVDYYCSHDEEREEIRKAGFERVKKDHTYKNRWQTILRELGLEES